MPFLTGSTFPLSLIRRPVLIEPETMENYIRRLQTDRWESFWGHANTLPLANRMTGCDLTPKEERPAVRLSAEGLPELHGQAFSECWILSPDYRPGFRPAIGAEVQAEDITGWQVLKITWCDQAAIN